MPRFLLTVASLSPPPRPSPRARVGRATIVPSRRGRLWVKFGSPGATRQSALPSRTDVASRACQVRKVPTAGMTPRQREMVINGLGSVKQPRLPRAAPSTSSAAPSIVTSTSASFGINLVVVSEPRSPICRTPGQSRAERTKERTARSKCRRGSATEGVGDRLYFIWLAVASVTRSPRRRRLSNIGF